MHQVTTRELATNVRYAVDCAAGEPIAVTRNNREVAALVSENYLHRAEQDRAVVTELVRLARKGATAEEWSAVARMVSALTTENDDQELAAA